MTPFEDTSKFDELRRFASGAMSQDERARFEAEVRHDPELARLAAEFQEVWSATEAGLGSAPASRRRFEDLAPRLESVEARASWRRRAAAAAVFLALAAAGWFAWDHRHDGANDVVELRAIPWNASAPAVVEDAAVPAVLASWSPVENGRIHWLDSLDEARAVSAAVSRPIFVFGYIEQCPICQGFQRNEFQDPAILALVEQAVPVRINLMELDEHEVETLMARRYPLLEMQNERGEVLHTFAGTFAEVDMHGELAGAVAGLAKLDWSVVRELGAALASARSAEAEGRFGAASSSFEQLAAKSELPKFAAAGSAGLSRVGADAAQLLADARSKDAEGSAALAQFTAGVERFAGSPFERDLRAVQHAWSESGRFPTLAAPK